METMPEGTSQLYFLSRTGYFFFFLHCLGGQEGPIVAKIKIPLKDRTPTSTQAKSHFSQKRHSPAGKQKLSSSSSTRSPRDQNKPRPAGNESFPIAGIGASAGGLQALKGFITALPVDSGIGFILVQHLSPDHKSLMPELLAKFTSMSVQSVSDETPVEPNHVYVIPPNADLTIEGGVLRVAAPAQAHGHRTPIDHFFQSLSEDQGPYAICIILSGAGSDGTLGLRAVKEHGGISLAQSTDSAKFDSMPRSAILTGLVDHILPVEQMPEVLMKYAQYLSAVNKGKGFNLLSHETLDCLDAICSHLQRQCGHDFHQYKRSTLGRRIQRRMQILHMDSALSYLDRIQRDPNECNQLFQDLLIGVTQFFRDSEGFLALSREIIPKIIKSKKPGETIRIWVPGCSTGEEAYSIAMLIHEYLDKKTLKLPVHIFATDIDEQALDIARHGRYPEKIADHLADTRLARYFEKYDSYYQIAKVIRDMCIFSHHNLIGNPPFSRMDLISCRNLLIYLDSTLQFRVLSLFHYALNREGYLFLGPSEHAAGHSKLFREVNKRYRIFQAKEALSRIPLDLPLRDSSSKPSVSEPASFHPAQEKSTQYFERIVRQEYGPAAVLVDREFNIQYISGKTRDYLQLPSGTINMNMINMVRPDLRIPLRSGIFSALKTGLENTQDNIQVSDEKGIHLLDIIVRPLFNSKQESELFMVVFREKNLIPSGRKKSKTRKKGSKDEPTVIWELEQEIKVTRAHLQTIVEELEVSNQDLKSSNEELLSVNEELQSANEELQTSKEELQSVNEELETVNAQLAGKVEELDRANNDMENLFHSTDIATLFLDKQYRIKKYTPAAQKIFRILETDIGRPISDLAWFLKDQTLIEDIEEALRTLNSQEKERTFSQGPPIYLSRITPYRTQSDQSMGVVLTFVDITHLRKVEDRVVQFSLQQKEIADFALLALQERDVLKVMNEGVRKIVNTLVVEYAKVLELLPDGKSFLVRAGTGWKEGLVGQAVGGGRESQAGYTLMADDPVIVTDLQQETRFSGPPLLFDHKVMSGISCIIRDPVGNPYGVLGAHSTSKRMYSENEVKFLQTMANILAYAIHRKGIETQLQSVTSNLETRVQERTQTLLQHQQRIRNLSSELILTEQRERRRIAKELHDYLAQILVVGKIKMSQLQQNTLTEAQASILRDVEESLDHALTYTRDLIPQISPPVLYEFGLFKAITWLAEKMSRYDLHVTVTSHLEEECLHFPESVSVILYQVLRELLFNVLKHAQTVEAGIEITQASLETICFEVTDHGSGFDVDDAVETMAQSQKFGLLNVQERIEGLGGHLEVHSNPGEGTCIRIIVPMTIEEPAVETGPLTYPSVYAHVQNQEGVIRVVIADDHPIFREGLRTLLDACSDIQVIGEGENGEQAVDLVQKLHPNVVVMDINMPVMNGIEATRVIKARLSSVYIIGLSMHSDQIVKKAFSEAGGDQYVTKGDSFNSFAEIVRSSQREHGAT